MESDSSSSGPEPSTTISRQGRRRLRFEDQWAKKKRKIRKDRGKSYHTYAYEGGGDPKEHKQLCRQHFRVSVNSTALRG